MDSQFYHPVKANKVSHCLFTGSCLQGAYIKAVDQAVSARRAINSLRAL